MKKSTHFFNFFVKIMLNSVYMDDGDFTIDDILLMKRLGIPDISIKKIVGSKLYKKYSEHVLK